jgi:hypothetical protein
VRYEVNAVIGSLVVAGIKGWNWKSALASARPLLLKVIKSKGTSGQQQDPRVSPTYLGV